MGRTLNWSHYLVSFSEVALISIAVYCLFSFFWNTRAMDLAMGLLALFGIYLLTNWLGLPVLKRLMVYAANVAVIGVIIIFQPELRLALSRLSMKGRQFDEGSEFDRFLDSLTHLIYRMSEKRIGALVLLENQNSLEEYANQSVRLDARYSPELLESIFTTTTPLHDGAVIIRGNTLLSAATILPLADDPTQLLKSMGTRHRAALGMSQQTDALILVVSEEDGKVSIAREGVMTRGIKPDRFKAIIRSVFNPPAPSGISNEPFKFKDWARRWKTG